jgi:hypothetical protein
MPAMGKQWTKEDAHRLDKVVARILEDAGNTVSGLSLEEIGKDGHAVANELWGIAGYIRNRNA